MKSDQDFLFQGRKINCCLIIITGTGIMIFFLKICFEIHVYTCTANGCKYPLSFSSDLQNDKTI